MTGTSRDLGLSGNGKGSRPRNCGSKAFHQNYDGIKFPRSIVGHQNAIEVAQGFRRLGNKLRKTYR